MRFYDFFSGRIQKEVTLAKERLADPISGAVVQPVNEQKNARRKD